MKIIPIEGVIGWDVTEQSIREQLAAANGDEVEFHFSTPGGLCGAGIGIGSQIRQYPGKTTAVMTGYAMSMGSYLPQCCDHRVAMDDAVFMIHNARGMTWGDHNEILKYGNYVKGLSGVLAKRLAERSGNDLKKITGWMDDETFFFGDEIVEAGFADEIRKSGKESDKDTALATATAVYHEAVALMEKDTPRVKADLELAMAHFANETPPAKPAGTKTQEVQHMNLQELLAANPAAKAEFDAAIASARLEGEKAMNATIEKVAPFLGAASSYPPVISTTALKVLKGEEAMISLTAAVAAVDAVREEKAQSAASAGAAGETPASQTPQTDTGMVSSEADLDAAVAEFQQGGY